MTKIMGSFKKYVRSLGGRGGGKGVLKKRTKACRGRGEVMQECTYAHNER